jgi:hypothetical protein
MTIVMRHNFKPYIELTSSSKVVTINPKNAWLQLNQSQN